MINETAEIEEAVLGAILMESENCQEVFGDLRPEHFSSHERVEVFKAMCNLNASGEGIDVLTVNQKLKEAKLLESIGGSYYVSQLTNRIASSAHIGYHTKIIQQNFMLNQLKRITHKATIQLNEPSPDVFDMIAGIEKELSDLLNNIIKKPTKLIGDVFNEVIEECTSVLDSGVRSGVLCGIEALNKQTNGWQKGDLIILAGRPGMGKTSAGIDFCLTPALSGIPTAFFSLEMTDKPVAGRILSIRSSVNVQRIINKTISRDELEAIKKEADLIKEIPLFIDQTPSLTLSELRNKARRLKRKDNIELIVVDYLQLMIGDNRNREQEVSQISRGLKALAKELDIPVIALSQLSRKCEERADKKPLLSDLRESGAIEQDADIVIFCHRPEYYDLPTYQLSSGEVSSDGLFMFIISKFRNGQTGEIKARFIKELSMVLNY